MNGKSTFVCTLQQMLGDYARSVKPDLLLASTEQGANRTSPDLMVLCGSRFAKCQETDEGRALSASIVKQIEHRQTRRNR
jgi:putative DNA primase/helicase